MAIEQLLTDYRTAVARGDEKAFEALLLNVHIPFSGVSPVVTAGSGILKRDTHDFASFRSEMFDSGVRYSQTFSNVIILQKGALAQVSLDYVTTVQATGAGGPGWKVLQLLKVDGRWKIASEFYA